MSLIKVILKYEQTRTVAAWMNDILLVEEGSKRMKKKCRTAAVNTDEVALDKEVTK